MNTALFLLRAKQIGLTMDELDQMEEGNVVDMIIESGNDAASYDEIATQEDFDQW